MIGNCNKNILLGARNILVDKGYNVSYSESFLLPTGSVSIDMVAKRNKNLLLIEINNGRKIDLDDLGDLKRAEEYLKKESKSLKLLILTDNKKEVDQNIKKIAKIENIQVVDQEDLKKFLK